MVQSSKSKKPTTRATSQVTRFGGNFYSALDRYSDLALYIGLLVYYAGINRFFYIVLTAIVMTGSVMVSYTRARAENTIPKCKVGFLERPERVVLIIIGALFDRMAAVLWVIAVLSNVTVIHRMIYTFREATRLEDAQLRAVLLQIPPESREPSPTRAVCVSDRETLRTPSFSATRAATPCRRSVGFPEGRLATSKSCHRTPCLQPVPMAFMPASLAAKRAA